MTQTLDDIIHSVCLAVTEAGQGSMTFQQPGFSLTCAHAVGQGIVVTTQEATLVSDDVTTNQTVSVAMWHEENASSVDGTVLLSDVIGIVVTDAYGNSTFETNDVGGGHSISILLGQSANSSSEDTASLHQSMSCQ